MSELIKIEDVSVKYGNIEALRDLNFTIEEGDYIGIIGPNGGGKSTLLKTILGLVKPYKGTITFKETSLKKSNVKIGYVPQINELNRKFPITVKEVILSAKLPINMAIFHKYSEKDIQEVEGVLSTVGLLDIQHRHISELSGGEFQKMLIARALASNPDILLLDEPTSLVDMNSQKQIYSLIKSLNENMTIVIITHHVKEITKQAKKLIWLEKNIKSCGDPFEVYKFAYLNPTEQPGGKL
ncbi:MAG: metal ABC transporter ATP-binding protein [Tenericutes bacterium]|nr:metal ABC transporter ATP-binding protein [Mycoplasmatota bacterium]